MAIDTDALLQQAVRDGVRKGVSERLTSYNSPLQKMMEQAFESSMPRLKDLLEGSIASCTSDEAFCEEIRGAVRQNLAKLLIQRFGGEMEKQVNALKSDPTTRARITLAIEEIVKQKT